MSLSVSAMAEEIGTVAPSFKMIGPDNKIVVQAFYAPEVAGIAYYLSSAKTGGISGGLGLASDASDACCQVGPISFVPSLKSGKEIFSQKSSPFFKTAK